MSDETQDGGSDVLQQVVSIVSAYVSHNAMRAVELPEFIGAVHASILQLAKEPTAAEAKPPNVPAVPIKRSISKDFIICLEDGKKFKSLRRHLSSCYNMTPDEYRAKWGLPSDYPMVAPAYSATRSQLARESGLGQINRAAETAGTQAAAADEAVSQEPMVEDASTSVPVGEEAAPATQPVAEAAEPADAAGSSEVEAPKKAKRGRPRKVAA